MANRYDEYVRSLGDTVALLHKDHPIRKCGSHFGIRRQMSKAYLDSNPNSLRLRGAMVGASQPRAHWMLWRWTSARAYKGLIAMQDRAQAIIQGALPA